MTNNFSTGIISYIDLHMAYILKPKPPENRYRPVPKLGTP